MIEIGALCASHQGATRKMQPVICTYPSLMSKNGKCTMTGTVSIHVTIAVRLARSPRFLNGHAVAACPHTTRGQCARILYSGQGTKLVFFHTFCSLPLLATWVKHNEIKEQTPLWSQKNWILKRQKNALLDYRGSILADHTLREDMYVIGGWVT